MNQGHWQTGTASPQVYEQHMDYNQQDMSVQQEVGEDMDGMKKRKPWERLGPDGRPIKRKPNPAKRNMMLRKQLQPKNSVMCLNELHSGLKYVTEKVETVGNFLCTVEVNEQSFTGYGSSKDQAKQAAAENALMSFVKPPPPKPAAGEQPNPEDDTTPWKAIASFAMYKLFTDWRDNKIGNASGYGDDNISKNIHDALMTGFTGGMNNQIIAQKPPNADVNSSNIAAHLSRSAGQGAIDNSSGQVSSGSVLDRVTYPGSNNGSVPVTAVDGKQTLKPINQSKLNPEKLATSQPVMILHQMCPQIVYNSVEKMEGNIKIYEVSADINGQVFTGEGTAVKRAKIQLAKSALKALYDIDNVYAAP